MQQTSPSTMGSSVSRISEAACVLLFAVTAAHAAITGTIIGEDGKPIAGATIRAFAAESSQAQRARLVSASPELTPLVTVQSAEDGAFSIDPKSPLAELIISIGGRVATALEIADGQDAGVVVASSQSRHLRVIADGKPASNALVASGPLMLRTNAQGEVDLPESGLGRPLILLAGFAPYEDTALDSNVTLSKGVTATGKVVGANGDPVEHAHVLVDGWPLGETNAVGEFAIPHVPKNWRTIRAIRDSRIGEAPNKGHAIMIRVGPAVAIAGKAVPAARVMLRRPNDFWTTADSVIADAQGTFVFPSIAPGDYSLFGTHFGYSIGDMTISAIKNVTKSLDAKPAISIRGRVVDEGGAPVAGAVVIFGTRPLSSGGASLSRANGEFTVRGNLSPFVPQSVVAFRNGYAAGVSAPITGDSAKSPVTVRLPRGFPFVVKVVDRQRQPVPDAYVLLFLANPDSLLRAPAICDPALSSACHTTDASGSATFRAIDGAYAVNVRGETIATKSLPPQTLAARSSPLTIQVDRGMVVAGRVVYRDGTPVSDVTVMPRAGSAAMARTNPDGTFELHGVAAGPLSLVVRLPNSPAPAATVDVTAPDNNVTLTLPTPGRIEGRVTDKATGQPVTDFSVLATQRDLRYFGPSTRTKQIHSDAGTFSVDDAPLGMVTVRVTATGYAPQTNDIALEEGKTISDLAFQLERGGRIAGRVTANDQPVSGAAVRLGGEPTGTTTDADGQYAIEDVAAGDHIVDVSKSGFIPQHKSIEVAAGKDAKLDIALSRGKDLIGRVVDANGQAVVNARLFVRNGGRTVVGYGPGVFSDGDGQFKVEGLADGHYSISAQKDGFVNATADGDVPATTPVTITMKTGGTITGRVVGLSDAELANAYVYGSSPAGSAHTQVEASGAFTLRGVPDGRVSVSASSGGMSPRRSAPKIVEVMNGTADPVEIDFAQGATISGHVTQNAVPVSGGNVNFSPKKGEGGGVGQINADGFYSVSGLVSGDYIVRVFTYSGSRYETDYTVSGSGTFDVDMKGATLHGRVVDASTGEPVSDASVSAEGTKEMKFGQSTMTGSDGRFSFSAVPDGTITLSARREKYSSGTQTVVVASGAAPDAELRLDRGQEAVIQILDAPSGNPINGFVNVMSGHKSVGSATPGDDGKMHVWLPPGAYRASVSASDYVPTSVDVTVPGPEVRAALMRAGRLMILSKNGGDVQVSLAGLPFESTGKRMVHIQSGTSAFLGGLAPGHYTIDLMNSDRTTVKQSYSVDVVAGQTAELTIE